MVLRRYTHRARKDTELADEIESHLAHEQDAQEARGKAPEDAQRQARLRFGNPRSVREQVWRYRSLGWAEDIARDVWFALRSLRKTPGFTTVALLVIAIGIGANAAVFSVIDAVLLKPLTYPDAEQLVQVVTTGSFGAFPVASIPEYNLWRQQTSIFQQIAGYDNGGAGMNLTGGEAPQQVQAIHVTADYFAMFGAPLALGRTFTAAEDQPNGGHVVVLSYGLWRKRYGGDPKIVGSNIAIDGQPFLVVGVIGRGFVTDGPADLWVPMQMDLNSHEMVHTFVAAARLRPGVTMAQANAQMKLAAVAFQRIYGERSLPPRGAFGVVSLRDFTIGDIRRPLLVLLGAVVFVLLIACSNLANLLLARASVRRRELATRAALGAGRGQIIRQLLTESLVLSLSGGVLGLICGFLGVRLLLSVNPGNIPRIGESGAAVALDFRVLLFTFAVAVLTGVLFGLFPAIAASRPNLAAALNESSGRSGMSYRQGKVRSLLVVSEVALALVLVIGAALLIRTFYNLEAVKPGFGTHNILTMTMSMSGSRFQKSAPVAQVIRSGRERLMAIPGVEDAAVTNALPMEGGFGMVFDIVGRPRGSGNAGGGAGFDSVSWSYFSAFQIPLLRGRLFTEQDDAAAPGVVIINEALAKRYWPNGDPLRDRMLIGAGAGPAFAEPPRQVIGIVGNTHDQGADRQPTPMMYIPLAQMPDGETALNSKVAPLWWIVRSRVNPYTLLDPIQAALREASGGLPVAHIRSMDEVEARNLARQRFNMLLLMIFGAAGLLMAAIGVYGVMSYSVQQRTQELGVRMALGAQAWNLRNMVIGQGMMLAALGVIVGMGGAFWLTRFLSGFLFGVKAWDPTAFVATALLLLLVALLAVWVPAARATRVDPMTALRLD
ncbi:MAG TPA: ABC transporter permease [Acidobacteriaceae bacterium]|nr:ABC transporter permease [Acidobacteriaceae bacterium]